MKSKNFGIKENLSLNIDSLSNMIVDQQRSSGEIPWCRGMKTDPWDMVESIMGLGIGGHISEARLGFNWLKDNQLEDGSWHAAYMEGEPEDQTRDTNMTTYIAVGVFHHFLLTGDREFLKQMWDTVRRAIDFAVKMQAPGGEIYWARNPAGKIDRMALITGSSSVYMSLKCAIATARELSIETPEWELSAKLLGECLREKPHSFNIGKSRYSMYWFYPVLSGALKGPLAAKRIEKYWDKYMVEGLGVRCVSDEPWVTVAETSELVLALDAMGQRDKAEIVFGWISGRVYEDDTYWCGFTFPNMVIWPEDRLTWTNAVVLMAADALYGLTPAGQIFSHSFWESYGF